MNFVSNLLKFSCFGLILLSMSCDKAAKDINPEKASFFSMNDDGELIRPTNYRTWVYVGTPVTPNDMNGGKAPFPEMHNVYIDPASYQIYKATGKFRDGTILVKELTSVGSKSAVSGKGYFMGEFTGLEASLKSTKHFPDEPGNWAIFSFTNPAEGTLKETAAAMPTAACNACHNAAAADDWVFTQYYPVLRDGKAAGKKAAGGVTSKLKSTHSDMMGN